MINDGLLSFDNTRECLLVNVRHGTCNQHISSCHNVDVFLGAILQPYLIIHLIMTYEDDQSGHHLVRSWYSIVKKHSFSLIIG